MLSCDWSSDVCSSDLPPHIHPLAPPSLHAPHIHVLGLTSVHLPHCHFLSCHPFHLFTWVLVQPLLSRSHPPTVCLLAFLQASTHPLFRLSRLLGYLHPQKISRNVYQRHLLVGQGSINMDTKLVPRHLTKDMQDLLLIIRDGVRFEKGNSNDTLFQSISEVEGEVVGLYNTVMMEIDI